MIYQCFRNSFLSQLAAHVVNRDSTGTLREYTYNKRQSKLQINGHNDSYDWDVNQWWSQNRLFDDQTISPANIKNLKFSLTNSKISELRDEQWSELWSPSDNMFELFESQESQNTRKGVIPMSSVDSIKDTILKYFSHVRSYRGDRSYYRKLKRTLKDTFLQLGLTTALQSFWPKEMPKVNSRDKAHNIIGIWPGTQRGTPKDKIIVIGAHYDTVSSSPGVDDNGSGSAAVLEIAKLVAQNNCKLDKTLMFVLFDMEEDGLKGSKYFVKDYLIPIEVIKNGAQVMAVIVMDMILEHDSTRNSQSLGTIANVLPDWGTEIKQNGYRGDFAAVWARKGVDTKIFDKLQQNWLNSDKYGLSLMAPALPELGSQVVGRSDRRLLKYQTFLRSDHASFWYPPQKYMTFPAILITDLGPWRRNMKNKYHRSGDDTRSLSDDNLAFLKNTIDSVINTIFDLSKGKCDK
ncbi:uncharacterized protein LOC128963350 [Oppia nitens]|uniref:uncharacterized protein LOC128963350 n=1 Tax=Oppia nitens TaxID=1686743 RepID=UPI0023DC6451|nr:uncharacterized protein LOC128963350 [Oppia nitens]